MIALPRGRRVALALGGIFISAAIMRTQLADALVVRGDGCLYRARPACAFRYYRRAMWFDSDNGLAVDRFVFVAMMTRDRAALDEGVGLASTYLRRHPDDSVVRMDRAMVYRAAGRNARALLDFAIVGRHTHDARALTFAGFAAKSIGQRARAKTFWLAALAFAPGFPPARHALDRARSAP